MASWCFPGPVDGRGERGRGAAAVRADSAGGAAGRRPADRAERLPIRAFRPSARAASFFLSSAQTAVGYPAAAARGVTSRSLLRELPVVVHRPALAQLFHRSCAPPPASPAALVPPPTPLRRTALARTLHAAHGAIHAIRHVGTDSHALALQRRVQLQWYAGQTGQVPDDPALAKIRRAAGCFQPVKATASLADLLDLAAAEGQAASLVHMARQLAFAQALPAALAADPDSAS